MKKNTVIIATLGMLFLHIPFLQSSYAAGGPKRSNAHVCAELLTFFENRVSSGLSRKLQSARSDKKLTVFLLTLQGVEFKVGKQLEQYGIELISSDEPVNGKTYFQVRGTNKAILDLVDYFRGNESKFEIPELEWAALRKSTSRLAEDPRNYDWLPKLQSAIERQNIDGIGPLTAWTTLRQLDDVLETWSKQLELKHEAAIYIAQQLAHLYGAAISQQKALAPITKLFTQTLLFAHSLNKSSPSNHFVERLSRALLAADMTAASFEVRKSIVEIVRAHREIIQTDTYAWPFLAPLL